ncbi:MAG: V/A-type H+/Na+-transporting ATPase subunit [Candidatus Atribacteria bacterium]|nr:V/A-type H+/Na+-transporting ATPase subunit [Candidatus Atribacteria bacterium]
MIDSAVTPLQTGASKNTEYGYLIGRVRVWESGLLNPRLLDQLLRADNADQAGRIVSEIPQLGEVLQNVAQNPPSIDQALMNHFWSLTEEISGHRLGAKVAEFFTLLFHFSQLKLLLKRHLAQKPLGSIPEGVLDWNRISRYISGEKEEYVPDLFRQAIDQAKLQYEKWNNIQAIELVIDRLFLSRVLKLSRETESSLLKNWFIVYVAFALLRGAFRIRLQQRSLDFSQLIYLANPMVREDDFKELISAPADKVVEKMADIGLSSVLPDQGVFQDDPYYLATMEKIMDNYLLSMLRPYQLNAFGPEPVFGFLFAKNIDIKNLRIVLHGKYFEMDERDLRDKVRECYYE